MSGSGLQAINPALYLGLGFFGLGAGQQRGQLYNTETDDFDFTTSSVAGSFALDFFCHGCV